ncbi:hypothetical protein [Bowmanella denitrificans]|uniref:hypothetical protein n=1 Tax=Bowmanella denitrificans TaxID=366582 RepID=UPI000C9BC2BC|nr:hypothetical protein [Bowmanella denitrificans]
MSSLFLLTRPAYLICLSAMLILLIVVTLPFSAQQVSTLALGHYHRYQCQTSNPQAAQPAFRILTVTSMLAQDIADQLCASDVMAQHYRSIIISWKPRGQLNAAQILNEEYDLIWSREHNMQGLVPEFANYYDTLLQYDHYQVYWFSRGDAPVISQAGFADKKIGLLNDKLSHTHYLLPLTSIKEAGIEVSDNQLVYFDDGVSLFEAFSRQQVDLISGGLWLLGEIDLPLQRTLISDHAIAATLFIRKLNNPQINCEAARAMNQFAAVLSDTHTNWEHLEGCDGRP